MFASISTGDIHIQNYDKVTNYKNCNGYEYQTKLIESPSANQINIKNDFEYSIALENECVYFVGTASFRKKAILYERGVLETFLNDAKNQAYEMIYIRDEAHLGAEKNEEKTNLENLVNKYFYKKFYVSATLEIKKHIDVEISENEAIIDGLIKKNFIKYHGLENSGLTNVSSQELLECAIAEFKNIKSKYVQLSETINPAMLIQISSKNAKNIDENEQISWIIEMLENHQLKYVLYTSSGGLKSNSQLFLDRKDITKENKQNLVNNHSLIDVIIFKVALATGWDIPRACMLVQLREIHSETLDKQTIGRIRRNPLPNEKNSILDSYYVYSNYENSGLKDYQVFRLQKQFEKHAFKIVKLTNEFENVKNYQTFKKDVYDLFEKNEINNNYENFVHSNKCVDQNGIVSYLSKIDDLNLHDGSKISYTENIYNIFDVQKRWIQSQNKSDQYFEEIEKLVNEYCSEHNLNQFIFKLMLIDKVNQNISSKLYKAYNENHLAKEKYFLENKAIYLAKETFQFVQNKFFAIIDQKYYKNLYYLLQNRAEDKSTNEKLTFDSKPEQVFVKEIFKIIAKNNDLKFVFTKNYLEGSEIKYEYKFDDGILKKATSFPDFIINFEDKIYIIEIKSYNSDYNPNKTNNLISAFKEHSKLTTYYHVILWVKTEHQSNETFSWKKFYQGELVSDKVNVNLAKLSLLFINDNEKIK